VINRFSVPPLSDCTKNLANVASGKNIPDLILSNARILSTYTDRILEDKEIWISNGRIACVKDNNESLKLFNKKDLQTILNYKDDIENKTLKKSNLLKKLELEHHIQISGSTLNKILRGEY